MLIVFEADVTELNLMFEAADVYRLLWFLDVVLGKKYLVDTFH